MVPEIECRVPSMLGTCFYHLCCHKNPMFLLFLAPVPSVGVHIVSFFFLSILVLAEAHTFVELGISNSRAIGFTLIYVMVLRTELRTH